MDIGFLALASKCSGNVDEDKLIFKSYYIYNILAQYIYIIQKCPTGHAITWQSNTN